VKPSAFENLDCLQRLGATAVPKMRRQGNADWIVAIWVGLIFSKHRVSQDQMCERRMTRPEFRKDDQIW
ncbi:uncharacterized protein METZ01_LOCUS406765, partial [marine metagenome]